MLSYATSYVCTDLIMGLSSGLNVNIGWCKYWFQHFGYTGILFKNDRCISLPPERRPNTQMDIQYSYDNDNWGFATVQQSITYTSVVEKNIVIY